MPFSAWVRRCPTARWERCPSASWARCPTAPAWDALQRTGWDALQRLGEEITYSAWARRCPTAGWVKRCPTAGWVRRCPSAPGWGDALMRAGWGDALQCAGRDALQPATHLRSQSAVVPAQKATLTLCLQGSRHWEMIQDAEGLAPWFTHLSPIPRAHSVESERQHLKGLLWLLRVQLHIQINK